jgi:hypothetical protein
VTEAANAATLTAGTVAADVPQVACNYVTGAWHFYDFLSGDHDRLNVKWPSALVYGRRGPRAPDARHRPENAGRPGMHSLAMDTAVAHADGLLAPSRRVNSLARLFKAPRAYAARKSQRRMYDARHGGPWQQVRLYVVRDPGAFIA